MKLRSPPRRLVDARASGGHEIQIERYAIATNYPKRTYDDPSVTLRDSGLHPQAVVFVQDLDA